MRTHRNLLRSLLNLKNLRVWLIQFGLAGMSFCSLEAELISHYVFTDGDLLDNEVVTGPALTNAGPSAVTLGSGTAVFTAENNSNTTGDNYLLSDNASGQSWVAKRSQRRARLS